MTHDWVIESVSFDRIKAGVFDERDEFGLCHLYFVVVFDRITFREFAAFGDSAVEVVRAAVERDLRELLTEHHPIGFDVLEVIKQQSRDGDGL